MHCVWLKENNKEINQNFAKNQVIKKNLNIIQSVRFGYVIFH